jgi:hypothetical protein
MCERPLQSRCFRNQGVAIAIESINSKFDDAVPCLPTRCAIRLTELFFGAARMSSAQTVLAETARTIFEGARSARAASDLLAEFSQIRVSSRAQRGSQNVRAEFARALARGKPAAGVPAPGNAAPGPHPFAAGGSVAGKNVERIAVSLGVFVREVVGFNGELHFDTSKPDGAPRKLLDVSRLQALGWRPRIPLREGVMRSYRWFIEHQHNYRG